MSKSNFTSLVGAISKKKEPPQLSFTPKTISPNPQVHEQKLFIQIQKQEFILDSDDILLEESKIHPSKSPNLYPRTLKELEQGKKCPTILSFIKRNNKKKLTTKTQPDDNQLLKQKSQTERDKNAEELEKQTKSLTNTIEEGSNFYEYTISCLKIIVDIRKQNQNIEKPKKVSIKTKTHRKLAIFDLDETLVHCVIKNYSQCKNIIKVKGPSGKEVEIGVNIRPHWKEALDRIKKLYTLVIYTASHNSYADSVLNFLDPNNQYFNNRLYRNNCIIVKYNNKDLYIKDLSIFNGYSLKDMVIVDNSVLSFAFDLDNGIPIVPYYDAIQDSELFFCASYLEYIVNCDDLRIANRQYIQIDAYLLQAIVEIEEDKNEYDEDIENRRESDISDSSGDNKNKIGKKKSCKSVSNDLQFEFEELRNKFNHK